MSTRRFLEGRVSLVTGAGRGLGAATAEVLAQAGATVVLAARHEAEIGALADRLAATGATVQAIATDIGDDQSVETLIGRVLRQFGGLDVVVNIAGTVTGVGKPVWALAPEEWRPLIETNVTGAFLLARYAVPAMLQHRAGRLLFLTSTSAERAMPSAGLYGASKAAVNQLVRALALELVESGVTVNAFNPGPVATPTLAHVERNLAAGPWRHLWISLARPPEHAARLILWLLSPEASHISGEVIHWNDPRTVRALRQFEWQMAADPF